MPPTHQAPIRPPRLLFQREALIALLAIVCIAAHLLMRTGQASEPLGQSLAHADWPLLFCLAVGGIPLLASLLGHLFRGEFGADLLAGISIVTAVCLHEYLAGTLVVLMLSGGATLEAYSIRNASSVLSALANRMPLLAHRVADGKLRDVSLADVAKGDLLRIFPHEICPVDGVVVDGHGSMDESFLTGEPYLMSKAPGTEVFSGAINGDVALTIRAHRLADDSRYARIMQVMNDSVQRRPQLRRLGDQLGAVYTPLALLVAVGASLYSGDVTRFLAVLVVATPCPLLIAIPVAIVGSISLAARRGIIIKDPAVLETVSTCRIAIFDKTGTLTYGKAWLAECLALNAHTPDQVLRLVASAERYSKHPLGMAILDEASRRQLSLAEASEVNETPGEGLRAVVDGRAVEVTSRQHLQSQHPALASALPAAAGGMECIVLVDDEPAAVMRFRDQPRREGGRFVNHLQPRHHFQRVLIVSGDRASEVNYLAEQVGISEVHAEQSPEQKQELVRRETALAATLFLGDGINDAPALAAATVGIAFGQQCDITAEAAGAVIMDSSLQRVDEFLHIGQRMRKIALQSAIGGMLLSLVAMLVAAAGYLAPVWGAVVQEVIDVFAVLNALRVVVPHSALTDYEP